MMKDVYTSGLISIKNDTLYSTFLNREVLIDFYFPPGFTNITTDLLLINDGQDLPLMPFADILSGLYQQQQLQPLLCIGIHCGTDRKNEYGTASQINYRGQGAKAGNYTQFILQELLPYIKNVCSKSSFSSTSFAGFSLGGLGALDIVLNHPEEFDNAAAFSGSFWWRSRSYGRDYNDDTDRIMHAQIRRLPRFDKLSFFFECGALDELADRNNNGIIDSIDDTLDIIKELKQKGYTDDAIKYVEIPDGMHNVATWAKAFPDYLLWRWGK
jgi:enterochelin esterase-like enzyme